jgi:hypothetical protein
MAGTTARRAARCALACAVLASIGFVVNGQTIRYPWSGFGNSAQHTAVSKNASQNLLQVFWSTPVDLQPQYTGSSLLIHYGSPLCTKVNLLLIPVKVGPWDNFRVEARRASNASLKWSMNTDYLMPPHNWGVQMGMTLTPNNVLYLPGAGGTLLYRKQVDGLTGETGRQAFYGMANYNADPTAYNDNVYVNTPLTSDNEGTIYFGYWATGETPLNLKSGIARVNKYGVATYISAAEVSGDPLMSKVVSNCAPALSNDNSTLYVAVHSGNRNGGYLLGLDRRTLKLKYKVRLKDVKNPANDARLFDDGTASPMVGPDGDVYYGVLENPLGANHYRGWMLHFNSTLTVTKPAGAFGWDNTPSMVTNPNPAAGGSSYFIMTKYNHYAGAGGDGVNKIALLDPNQTMVDPISGATVMKEVMVIPAPTPDEDFLATHPNAVREWCINTAAYDPVKRCIFANCEDGKLYRWNLNNNTLDQVITLTEGIGEAYTPTIIGTDGLVYAINNARLYCVGEKRAY